MNSPSTYQDNDPLKLQILDDNIEYKTVIMKSKNEPNGFDSRTEFVHSCNEKSAAHVLLPNPAEINPLIALYNAGRFAELESQARLLVDQFPDFGFGWKLLGGALQMQNKDALPEFQKAARLDPEDAETHFNLGVVQRSLGQFDNAIASYQRAVAIRPDYAEAHINLGNLFKDLGRLENAVACFRRALELKPNDANTHYNLGNIQIALGRHSDAIASYRRALELKPDFTDAHSNLGSALRVTGQHEGALESYHQALELMPASAEAHLNVGSTLKSLGRPDDAIASYRRALAIKPDYAEAHYNLGNVFKELGQFDNAVLSFRHAVQFKQDFADAFSNLGSALKEIRQYKEALENHRRALDLDPDSAEAHFNFGASLRDLGRFDEAVASYHRALEINPDFAEAHNNLGIILQENWQIDEAVASYRRALELKPDFANFHANLGSALKDIGQFDEAIASYRRALELKPDFAGAYSNLLFCLSHSETVDAQTLFAEHCRFGEQFETPLRATWPQHGNSRDPARTLQVGFVSGDLHDHATSYFFEPVLAHLSGYPQLSLHAYYNNTIEDAVTLRLKEYLTHWHYITRVTDDALAQMIRQHGIDILIDLSGHTGNNRLMAFARKPAPVQASWIGYPGTTGLHAMDCYFADRFYLPHEQFAGKFTERIVHLPANAPFLPNPNAPPVNVLPALNNGYLTFGSFNRPNKISRSVIMLWSQLLRALPDSRMLLGTMNKDGNYTTLIDWFAQEGITRERLDFHVRTNMQRYLGLHHQVDICLDTFPYAGYTTTLHALWMGVPTLTLAGNTAAGRQGASALIHTGLDAFVARDAAGFVQKGLSWAGDLAELSAIRAGSRERFAQSAVGQPALIAAGLERAMRIMWQRWCEGLSPVAIDASAHQTNHETRPLKNEISANPGSQGR
jgi:protein O-GlcNAc transferase